MSHVTGTHTHTHTHTSQAGVWMVPDYECVHKQFLKYSEVTTLTLTAINKIRCFLSLCITNLAYVFFLMHVPVPMAFGN